MKKIVPLLVLLVILLGGMGWYYYSDGQVKKRMAQASLDRFAAAIATKDRAQVSASLKELLADDAKIHLEVHFFSIGNGRPMLEQNFDKTQFISFIDNTLYPLTDYSYTPSLSDVEPDTGTVQFTSVEWADGANMMGGVSVNMRYSSNTGCTAKATFDNDVARLKETNCKLQLRQVPKPGQEVKFLNKEGLKDLLGK